MPRLPHPAVVAAAVAVAAVVVAYLMTTTAWRSVLALFFPAATAAYAPIVRRSPKRGVEVAAVAIALTIELFATIAAFIAAVSSATFLAKFYYTYVAFLTVLAYYDIAADQDP